MYKITQAMKDQVKGAGLYIPSNMLSASADAKTVKGEKKGYLTGILYIQPTTKVCPSSLLADCAKACLYSAGRGVFTSVQLGRINKGGLLTQFEEVAMIALYKGIKTVIAKAKRMNLTPAIRLNGTSDIDWTNKKLDGKTLFEHFPTVQFYDYSKVPSNVRKSAKFANYHVTVSYSNAPTFKGVFAELMKYDNNVAVVFRGEQPETFLGYPVISGDDSDLRFLDREVYAGKAIVGLYAKGKAKKDDTFVVDMAVYGKGVIAIAA